MDHFFDAPSRPNAGAVSQMLQGSVPINENGLISIQGRVHAMEDININGGQVQQAGTLAAGVRAFEGQVAFSDLVNIEDVQVGTHFERSGGQIKIVAAQDIQHTGQTIADGADQADAGFISLTAGNDINVDVGSLISAKGQGENSNGGEVYIFADNDAAFAQGALIDVSGGEIASDGGFIEFSAKQTVNLNGGTFKASAMDGNLGMVLIDPADVIINNNNLTNGTNLNIQASN